MADMLRDLQEMQDRFKAIADHAEEECSHCRALAMVMADLCTILNTHETLALSYYRKVDEVW